MSIAIILYLVLATEDILLHNTGTMVSRDLEYTAPEVLLGLEYDHMIDWWSIGIMLYEMLLGVLPFSSMTVQEYFSAIVEGMLWLELLAWGQ